MIHLTRINRAALVLNADLIEHVETTPDTVISMTTGQKFVVIESVDEVIRKVMEFRKAIGGCRCYIGPGIGITETSDDRDLGNRLAVYREETY